MFTSWKDYIRNDENSNSWSLRITGSGHITMSALLQQDGTLKAFPPLAAGDAFPVFMTLDGTAGGKITESFQGVYSERGWERSCEMEGARAELWRIFLEHYRRVREKQARTKAEREAFVRFVSSKLESPEGSIDIGEDDEVFGRGYPWHCKDILQRLFTPESMEFAQDAVGTLQTIKFVGWFSLVEIPQPEAPKFFVANFLGNKENLGGRVLFREVAAEEVAEWV